MEELKSDSSLLKTLIKYFLQGLFYIVPTAVTIYVIYYLVVMLDNLIPLEIPGLGILFILLSVTLIGFLGSHFFFTYFKPFERAIEKTPLIKIIYSSMKDLMNAFVGKKQQFKRPVLVKMDSQSDAERLGFITKDNLNELGIEGNKVAVYLPFSYAISGQVYIVPTKNVTPINASSADVMKLIISGGVTSVEQLNQTIKNNNDEKME
ncbi:MAG: hypothetical protein CMC96_02165 [Flavobacteriales bacterium]|nr:hypothetical protein [Flavobacteriales bacterium]